MKIQWLGHSAFRLEESTGTSVVTDPYDAETVGYEMQSPAFADVVTVSHAHKDHNDLKSVKAGIVLNEVGSYEIKGVHITAIESYHDNCEGELRGNNMIFKFRMDGINVCHLGDLGEECTAALVEQIGSVNVLLIPVGGEYTIDAEQAKEYVDKLMPEIVIPMHFRTRSSRIDLNRVESFLRLFDEDCIEETDGDSIVLSRSQLDDEYTKVIVFDRERF